PTTSALPPSPPRRASDLEASFVPLFITGMARLQDPPVDLADPRRRALGRPGSEPPVKGAGPRSGQTRLSLLEMQLIIAAFDRNADRKSTRLNSSHVKISY